MIRPGFASPSASSSAPRRSVPRDVGSIVASRSRSSRRLSVNSCTTCGVSAKLMIIAVMPESIWSISPPTSFFASSSRFLASVDVGRRHAGRVVDQKDEPIAVELRPLPTRPQQREHRQRDQQQLQKHQQILPQPLPQAVDVQVLDRPLPQIRARHLQRLPLQLQEIQRNDRRRHERQEAPLPRRERVAETHSARSSHQASATQIVRNQILHRRLVVGQQIVHAAAVQNSWAPPTNAFSVVL